MKTHLVVHHSLTNDGSTVSAQAIRQYHVETNGWRDVGYHLLVELIGDRYEMLIGRPLNSRAAAAHQKQMNRLGVHVCFIGNFDAAKPPVEMLRFAAPHLYDICDILRIPIDRDWIIGHREVAAYKSCPGKLFDMDAFVRLLRGG